MIRPPYFRVDDDPETRRRKTRTVVVALTVCAAALFSLVAPAQGQAPVPTAAGALVTH